MFELLGLVAFDVIITAIIVKYGYKFIRLAVKDLIRALM